MTFPQDVQHPPKSPQNAAGYPVAALLLAVGLFCFAAALRTEGAGLHMLFFGAAVGISGVAIFLFAQQASRTVPGRLSENAFEVLTAASPEAALLSDGAGGLLAQNPAARTAAGQNGSQKASSGAADVASWFDGLTDNGAALTYRLLRQAIGEGAAREVVPTLDGGFVDVTASATSEGRRATRRPGRPGFHGDPLSLR